MDLRARLDSPMLRYGMCLLLAGCVGIFVYSLFSQPISLTPDSSSYLETAEIYMASGRLFWEPSRTPGYPFLILVLVTASGVGSQSALVPLVVFVQMGLYLFLLGSTVWCFWRAAGLLAAVLAALLFACDHFNQNWITSIAPEAVSRIFVIAAINFLCMAIHRRSYRCLMLSVALVGMVPLFRPSDIVFPLATIAGMIVYAVWTRPKLRRIVTVLALLLGPAGLLIGSNGVMHGLYNMDTRSAPLLAARALALANPENLVEAGIDRRIIDRVARPMYEAYSRVGPVVVPFVNDLGREDGTFMTFCPFERHAVVGRLRDADPERFRHDDPYRLAVALQVIGRSAFLADIPGFMSCTRHVIWDYVRLPLLRPLRDISIKNKSLILPVIVPFVSAGLVFWFRRRSPISVSIIVACLFAAAGYWVLCGLMANYVVRIAMHPWLPLALASLLAVAANGQRAARRSVLPAE